MLVCVAAPCTAADADCDASPAPALLPVSRHVWRVPAAPGESDPTNAGRVTQLVIVQDGARVWLVGSGPTPAFGEALACAIQRRLGRAVTDVLNTRAGPELSMGNAAFKGARLWALPDVIEVMQSRCPSCLERLKGNIGAAGESLEPDRILIPSMAIGLAGEVRGRLGPFSWRALARAPGERTLVLRHPGARLVVAQGLLWAGDVPNLRDTNSATMLASLHELQRFAAGARLLGEQGGLAEPQAVAEHVAYIGALRRAALMHLVRGDVDGASGIGIGLPGFAGLPGYALGHPLNLQRIWRELELEVLR